MSDERHERPGYLPKKKIHWPEIPCKQGKIKKKERWNSGTFLDDIANDRRLYEDLQRYREEKWHELVDAFEANPTFFNSYQWLQHHPLFYWFATPIPASEVKDQIHEKWLVDDRGMTDQGLDFMVVRVDPETGYTSDDPALNTQVEFWYEVCFTKWGEGRDQRVHDYKRDGGARTYEEAVVKAAKTIHAKYGNDRRKFDKSREERA